MLPLESGDCWGEDNRRRFHCGEALGGRLGTRRLPRL